MTNGLIHSIEQRYAVRALLFIRDHHGCSIVDCMRTTDGGRTVYTRVRTAFNLGLLGSEQGHTVHNRRNLHLSPKGQIVTSHITAIMKEMGA